MGKGEEGGKKRKERRGRQTRREEEREGQGARTGGLSSDYLCLLP
jgi:hypothetical protein